MVLVKQWAGNCNLNCSRDKTFSSHAWTCLVVFYLQRIEEPLLPLVPWEAHRLLDTKPCFPVNKVGIATLFAGFFRFYTEEFSLWTYVVDMRDLRKRRKREDGWKMHAQRAAVEDPFDPDPWADPCRSNDKKNLELILARMKEASEADSVTEMFEMGPLCE